MQELAYDDDNARMNSLQQDPNQAEISRADLAQKNENLRKCAPILNTLVLEEKALFDSIKPDPQMPITGFQVETKLSYQLHYSDLEYCEDEDNILATRNGPSASKRGALLLPPNRHDCEVATEENWLGKPSASEWMSDQTWLCHDLVDHGYCSTQPEVGLSGLLRVGQLWIDVTTTRQFCFDLRTGEFTDWASDEH